VFQQIIHSPMRPVRGAQRSARRGVETLQLIIALPVLVIALVAGIQFGIVMIVLGTVTQAATVGARETGKHVDDATVVEVVDAVLGVHGLAIGPNATVVVERFGEPTFVQGGVACNPTGPAIGPDDVRVTVCVDLTTAPLLNCLTMYGLDFTGRRLEVSSVSTVE
jgi:hypothetical protein